MTEHQSSSTSGWLGALGRIFSGTSSSQNETKERVDNRLSESNRENASNLNGSRSFQSNTSSGRGLRYLNTPIVETRTSLDITRPAPLADSFSQSRKRINDEFRAPVETDISSLGAKRFRGLANHSLLEEPIRINVSERLDSTWNGVSALDSSPSSLRSLKSRMSEVPSTTSSGLSSKTRAILQQLERVHTPAKDARKLPTMRTIGASTEKWASIQNSSFSCGTPPPLKKTMGSVPSRIQLLSSRIGTIQRKPYWRDIVRAPKIHTESTETNKANNEGIINPVSNNYKTITPLFDIDEASPAKEKKKDLTEIRKPQPVLKGSDGKSKNVFSAKELEDDITPLPSVPAISLPQFSVPSKGFLDDIVFSFAPPKENKFENGVLSSPAKPTTEDETSDSDDSVSNSSVSSTSDGETSTEEQSVKSDKKESRPPTSTDSESSATPFSSKSISPQNREAEKNVESKTVEKKESVIPDVVKPESKAAAAPSSTWSCPDCFVSNKMTDAKCLCCGHINKANVVEEKRVDWDCPDCFVKNTANLDACQCCNYVKYKSSNASAANDNVFGDKAFNAQSFGSGFSFGVTPSSASSAPAPVFGFNAKTTTASSNSSTSTTTTFGFAAKGSEEQKAPAVSSAPVVAPVITFGSAPAAPSASSQSVFGSGKSLFGSSTPADTPLFGASLGSDKPATVSNPLSTSTIPTKPLFGSTEPPKLTEAAPLFGASKLPGTTPAFPSSSFGSSTENSSLFSEDKEKTGNLFGAVNSTAAAVPAATVPLVAPASLAGAINSTTTPAQPSGSFFQTEAPKPLFGMPMTFGAANSATEAPKLVLFGQGAAKTTPAATNPIPTLPAFGAASTTGLFGNNGSAPKPFAFSAVGGDSKKTMFGSGDSKLFPTASSSQEDVPAKKTFSSIAPASSATTFPFSQNKPVGISENKGLTGTMFGNTSAPQTFGGSNSSPSFGAWSTEPAASSLSASSSSNSLFSSNPEVSKGFQFGQTQAQAPGGSQMFQFGQPSIGNSTFNFSGGVSGAPAFSAPPNNPPPAAFQTSNDSALGGAFAFQSSGGPGRKMATARRRMGKK